tara:strand:- start:64 stop:231 length:168 start_codon:yes stop_codon:yes gene_type:complete
MFVDDPKSEAIFGRLGRKIFIESVEILARSISVKICGGVDRSRNRTFSYLFIIGG